jgi:hypothetical protein
MMMLFYTVWVGGVEVNDYYLDSLEDASLLADSYIDEGYDDVCITWKPKED